MSARRVALLTLLLAIWIFAACKATLEAVRPAIQPSQPSRLLDTPPAIQRLARHVVFVIVDGLRWDIANDRKRMPRFSEALRNHSSGELWAGHITMTSSAVLAFGAGQRGDLDQVLENLHPPLLGVGNWLENAKRAGLRVMAVGDLAWSQSYARDLDQFRADPEGVSIDHDFNAQTFRHAQELQRKLPDLLVAHFVTPDHQGHAYGVLSSRYAEHIRDFDRRLFEWLDSLTPDFTVIVTSDHGAAVSGTHGTDTTAQRRCPLFAYGPGIRPGIHGQRSVDQVEIPGLLSALLGVPNAPQSRGTVPFEWLDETPDHQRRLACQEIARLGALTGQRTTATHGAMLSRNVLESAMECCEDLRSARDCTTQARNLAQEYDRDLGQSQGVTSTHGLVWILIAVLTALVAALTSHGTRVLALIGVGLIWLVVSLSLTYSVERLPGHWPNVIRAQLFLLSNAVLLTIALRFKRWTLTLERHWVLALSVFPGWLLVSYTVNTQIEAYAVIVVLGWLACLTNASPSPRSIAGVSLRRKVWVMPVALLATLGLLAIPGTRSSDVCPAFFAQSTLPAAVIAGALLALSIVWTLWDRSHPLVDANLDDLGVTQRQERSSSSRSRIVEIAFGLSVVLLSFALRHSNISWIGRLAWVSSGLCAAMALIAGHRRLALVLGVTSYVWVSRDFECVVFASALVVAGIVSRGSFNMSPRKTTETETGRMGYRWVSITFLFALSYIQWIGLQGGLQLTTMDFAAGTFGDSHVPHWLTGACLAYKFLIAEVILIAIYTHRVRHDERVRLLSGLIAAHVARGVALLLMLATCGHSYWTAFRVVADLPFALVGLIGLSVMFVYSVLIKGLRPSNILDCEQLKGCARDG